MFSSISTTMYSSRCCTKHVDHASLVAGQQQDFISPQSCESRRKPPSVWPEVNNARRDGEGTARRQRRRRGVERGTKIRTARCLETVDDEHLGNINAPAVHVATARDSYGHHAHAYRPRHEAYEGHAERTVRTRPFDRHHSAEPPLTRFTTQLDRYVEYIMNEPVRFTPLSRCACGTWQS